ncbi:hypothetical protein ACVWXY_000343 [Thermostichus sp. MS-CIW-39]|jgi:hypothetical protein
MKKRVGRVVFASALTFFASSILLRAYGSHSIEWARQFGTPANEVADSIAVDRASGAEHFRASGAEHFRASGAEHFRASGAEHFGQGNAWVAGTTTGALPDQLSAGSWGASVLQVQSLSLSFLPLGERPCTE